MTASDRSRVRSLVMSAKAETTRTGGKPAIADVLREGIRQGLLAPGQPLIQASIAEVGSKVETMTARIGVVESDLRNIKIGWAVLVKAATVGSVITTTLAGIIAWLAWAIGWIKAH